MPTNGVGGFRDFLPAPRLYKSFFQSAFSFCPARQTLMFLFLDELDQGLRKESERVASDSSCLVKGFNDFDKPCNCVSKP